MTPIRAITRLIAGSRFLIFVLLVMGGACRQPSAAEVTAVPVKSSPVLPAANTAVPPAYPPAPTIAPTAYPPPATAVPPTNPPNTPYVPEPAPTSQQFLPLVIDDPPPVTPTPPSPTPLPTLNFSTLRAQLQAEGQDLAYAKIGFHAGVNGTMAGLEEWMRRLDAAGVPFFIKSVDNAEPLFIAQELMKQSGVPHTLVYRKVSGSADYDVPNYDLPPEEAARLHWQIHLQDFPSELDPSLVWLETMNEVDKNRSEWLAQFALATAQMALRDGYKWAAFGWASGEPEPEDWQSPAMLEFLRLAAANPDRIAIALHEYSYVLDDIGHEYPYKIGRFQELFRICDQYGIPRPTVLITEWGWTYEEVPTPDQAIWDINWAARLYAPYPQVKGAAIWYLGGGYSGIAHKTQRLIQPLTDFTLRQYFVMPLYPNQAPIAPDQFRP